VRGIDRLTGRLVVASPDLDDPNFSRAVVFVLDHDEDGALGVVLNRASEVPADEAIEGWASRASTPRVVFGGGPVEPMSLVALGRLSPAASRRDTTIVERIQLIDLDDTPLVDGDDVEDLRIFAGYAGWAPGQLEGEILVGAWHAVDARVDHVFTDSPTTLWRDVLRRQTGPLALLASYPDDPTLN